MSSGSGANDCHAQGLLCCEPGCPTTHCCPGNAPYGCKDNQGVWDCFPTQSGASYEVNSGVCRGSVGGGGTFSEDHER